MIGLQSTKTVPVPEASPAGFDYSGLDEQTVNDLHLAEQMYAQGKKMTERGLRQMSDGVATAHDVLVANCDKHNNQHSDDTFRAWCESIGITKDTAYRLLQVTALFDESSPKQQRVLQELSPSLLYAAAKPSAPPELVQQVREGVITTHKEYQEALAQAKAEKERADAAEARAKAAGDKVNELVERNEKLLDERDEHIRTIRQLESRPVEVMAPDAEQIDRLAAEKAWGLAEARVSAANQCSVKLATENAVLKEELSALREQATDTSQDDFAVAYHFVDSTREAFATMLPVFLRLEEGDRMQVCGELSRLLGRIMAQVVALADGVDPRTEIGEEDADGEEDVWDDEDDV